MRRPGSWGVKLLLTPGRINMCECVRYENERRRMFGKLRRFGVEGSGLKEVVGSLEIREGRRAVMSFLRETGVFRRI